MLLEVGGHSCVAAQSLTRALQTTVALHDPGAAVRLFAEHAAALLGRGAVALSCAQSRQLAGRGRGRRVLEDADDVVQEITEELWDTLISWEE